MILYDIILIVIGDNMKKIVNNHDNLKEEEINRIVKRAKIVLINDNDEILICNSKNNYFLLGGHVEGDESDIVCLTRELEEEAGINLDIGDMKLFMTIKYFNRDYPSSGINSASIANYYYLKTNVEPELDKIDLTQEEKEGNFRIEKIHISKVIEFLTNSLELATRRIVVEDTIEVLKEFIKEYL